MFINHINTFVHKSLIPLKALLRRILSIECNSAYLMVNTNQSNGELWSLTDVQTQAALVFSCLEWRDTTC